MLIIHTIPEAIGLMIVGIVLLGTWPAVWNLIEHRGRIPSHIFLDYSLTYLALGTLIAFTLGQFGPETPATSSFTTQLQQANGKMVAFALTGGCCLALGDLGMQYSTALLGLSIGPPLLNALTVIIGVILSYFLDGGINKPQLVFPAMAIATLAIALGAAAHISSHSCKHQPNAHDTSSNGSRAADEEATPAVAAAAAAVAAAAGTCRKSLEDSARNGIQLSCPASKYSRDAELGNAGLCQQQSFHPAQACLDASQLPEMLPGTLQLSCRSSSQHLQHEQELQLQLQLQQPEPVLKRQRSIQAAGTPVYLGLAITVIGGIIYSLFLPAFQIAANDPFGLLPAGVPPLTVYTTNFYFSIGFAFTSVVINVIFLYRPPFGTEASSVKQYLLDNRCRGLSILSGALAAFGDLTQFIGGQTAGYAAAMLVMAYPVVGVLWGMLRFKEFRQGSGFSLAMVVGQVLCYSSAVGLLAGSAELRSSH